MSILIILVHVITSVLLVTVILMQSGRGGGLTEAFAAQAESVFGAKTNEFLIKGTTVMAVIFFVTSLSLAYLSSRKEKSLMAGQAVVKQQAAQEQPVTEEVPAPAAEETQPAADAQ